MGTFNSLSYATKLVNAGVSRDQAEVHAQVMQDMYDQEHQQYATKADFLNFSHEVKSQIQQLEAKTDRLDEKTDRLDEKTDRLDEKTDRLNEKTDRLDKKTDRLEAKITQVEIKISAEIADLKTTIDECKNQFADFRSDVAMLRTSHKYIMWICGGVATMCLSMIALCIPIYMHTLK